MANAAEHAYPRHSPGEVAIDASYGEGTLRLVVTDSGTWREPADRDRFRGRGLVMITKLADRSEVRRGPLGTEVTMVWCSARFA